MLKYDLISSHGFEICHMLSKSQDAFFSNYRGCLYVRFNLFTGSLPGLWSNCYFVGLFWIEGLENGRLLLRRYLDGEDEWATFFTMFSLASAVMFWVWDIFFSSCCDSRYCFVLKKLRTHKFSLVSAWLKPVSEMLFCWEYFHLQYVRQISLWLCYTGKASLEFRDIFISL